MKHKKLNKKLSLKKDTVVNLSSEELNDAKGGATFLLCTTWTITECRTVCGGQICL